MHSPNLPALVQRKFNEAREAGDLTFYPTKVSIVTSCGVPFQARFSPALANKPKAAKDSNSTPVDVFENPTTLLVTEWPPAHNLVLNKFAINACHFILATQEFAEQTHLLEEEDLGAAYQCITAYKQQGEHLFAFFNSGEHSGASQRRRHIQFLPLRSMREGIVSAESWQLLSDQLVAGVPSELPFQYFAKALPKSPTQRQIHDIYIDLYKSAVDAVRCFAPEAVPTSSDASNTVAMISYNLAMTDCVLAIIPRLHEGGEIVDSKDNVVGFAALNGTVLGGTLLVKSELEFDTMSNDEGMLHHILGNIGVPRSAI